MRILVIEDEARLTRLIARFLNEEGYFAETAHDGRSGLSRALAEPFDLLIVDWMLPDLDLTLWSRITPLVQLSQKWRLGVQGNNSVRMREGKDVGGTLTIDATPSDAALFVSAPRMFVVDFLWVSRPPPAPPKRLGVTDSALPMSIDLYGY